MDAVREDSPVGSTPACCGVVGGGRMAAAVPRAPVLHLPLVLLARTLDHLLTLRGAGVAPLVSQHLPPLGR